MYSSKMLKKYLGPSKLTRLLAWVFFVLTVMLLAGGIYSLTGEERYNARAVEFDPVTAEEKSSAYLDIAGLSHWIYQYDNKVFYAAEDAEGYLYIVQLGKGVRLETQQIYWEREDNNIPAPEPYRVYGMVCETYGSLREVMTDVFEISDSEFEDYFGVTYLDATTHPGEELGWMLLSVEIFTFLFWLICLLIVCSIRSERRKSIRRLKELGELDNAVIEFESQQIKSLYKDKIRISENFLFGGRRGIAVQIKDIVRAYIQINTQDGKVTNQLVVIQNKAGSKLGLYVPKKDDSVAMEIINAIFAGNPEVIIGLRSN